MPALQHFSKLLSINDFRVSKLLTEPSGGSATYAASIDAVGVRSFSCRPVYDDKELFGDNTLLDYDIIPRGMEGDFEYAMLNLDLEVFFWGGTTVDAGVTPNQTATFTHDQTVLPVYCKLEVQCKQVAIGIGDIHVTLFKAKVSKGPDTAFEPGDYGLQKCSFKAVRPLSNDPIAKIVFNETAVVIP